MTSPDRPAPEPDDQPTGPTPAPPGPAGPPAPAGAAASAVPAAGGSDPVRAIVGLLLVVPAGLALLYSYVWPSLWTALISFTDYQPLGRSNAIAGRDTDFVGLANYQSAFGGSGLIKSFGTALSFALVPLLTILVVAPVLAYAADRAGRAARWTVRIALTLPLAAFAPVAIILGSHVAAIRSRELDSTRWSPQVVLWLGLLGFVCAVGATLYLAALRRDRAEPGADSRRVYAVLTVAALAGVTTFAVALQTFVLPLLTGRAWTPTLHQFRAGIQMLDYGRGAAVGTVVGVLVGVLGLVAVGIVLVSRVRIEVGPAATGPGGPTGWDTNRLLAAIVAGGVLVVVMVVAVVGAWPWLRRLGTSTPEGISSASLVANTWLPPLVSVSVGVLFALLAGFGIGALRPFGRWSELLLLPFAPWLFVGIGPLMMAHFERLRGYGQADTWWGAVPPGWVAIPALVVFTVLFRGLHANWQRARGDGGQPAAFGRAVLLPALPMVVLVWAATWLVTAQSFGWSYLSTTGGSHSGAGFFVLRQVQAYTTEDVSLGLVMHPVALVLFVLLFGALQVLYLERVAIRVGKPPA